mgnify:CR=1 FL=1
MNRTLLQPEFIVSIDYEKCEECKRCTVQCGFGALTFKDRIEPEHSRCVACHRCVTFCPNKAISVSRNPLEFRPHPIWTAQTLKNVYKQAETGGVLLTGMGNDLPFRILFDHIVVDACQVTNPSIDPLREPMELRTYLGRKPDLLEFKKEGDGYRLDTKLGDLIKIDIPVVFAPMSYGSISFNAQKAICMAAKRAGTVMYTGEGGLHRDLYPYGDHIILQVASGRFGVSAEYLNVGIATQIKIGQGAKPVSYTHLTLPTN